MSACQLSVFLNFFICIHRKNKNFKAVKKLNTLTRIRPYHIESVATSYHSAISPYLSNATLVYRVPIY